MMEFVIVEQVDVECVVADCGGGGVAEDDSVEEFGRSTLSGE